jgi:hypothetical protein
MVFPWKGIHKSAGYSEALLEIATLRLDGCKQSAIRTHAK